MREGMETLLYVLILLLLPILAFDFIVNDGQLWAFIKEETLIDETVASLIRFIT